MQNSDTPQGDPSCSLENKRPNILRRKTAFKSSDSISNGVEITSLLISDDAYQTSETQSEAGRQDLIVLKSREGKVFPRRRKPVERIILDTYICDKYRSAQKAAEQENVKIQSNSLLFHENQLSGDIFTLDIKNEFSGQGSVQNEGAQNPSEMEGEAPQPEMLIDAKREEEGEGEVSEEQMAELLRAAGLTEERLVVVEGPPARKLWLCPVNGCNNLYGDRPALHSHVLLHFNLKSYTCNNEDQNEVGLQEEVKQVEPPSVSITSLEAANSEVSKAGLRHVVTAALASVGISEEQMFSVLLPDGARCWLCPRTDCELTFKTQYQLKNHILGHYDLRPFKCGNTGCGWAFSSLGKLRAHLSHVHSGSLASKQHACTHPGCRKIFTTKYNLTAHSRQHEKGRERKLECPAQGCTSIFTARPALEAHLSGDHAPHDAAFRCGICGKGFWWMAGLAAHARAHAHTPGELACAWPGCGRRFPQPCRLRYHLRSHTGDKPYRCVFPGCNWAFPSASKLSRHARAHAGVGERRHVCTACGRAFLRAEHLREHLPRHLPHRHHRCDYPGCEEKFSNKSSVYVHKKREHGANAGTKTTRKRAAKGKEVLQEASPILLPQDCDDELLSLRSARTHVPWAPCLNRDRDQDPHIAHHPHLLQHHSGCDEKQGNPLVCGILVPETDSSVSSGFALGRPMRLEVESEVDAADGISSGSNCLPQLGGDLLAADHINSLLLQEELSDSMLYTAEDESDLQILLLNEHTDP